MARDSQLANSRAARIASCDPFGCKHKRWKQQSAAARRRGHRTCAIAQMRPRGRCCASRSPTAAFRAGGRRVSLLLSRGTGGAERVSAARCRQPVAPLLARDRRSEQRRSGEGKAEIGQAMRSVDSDPVGATTTDRGRPSARGRPVAAVRLLRSPRLSRCFRGEAIARRRGPRTIEPSPKRSRTSAAAGRPRAVVALGVNANRNHPDTKTGARFAEMLGRAGQRSP
jgi:hypothetical protein